MHRLQHCTHHTKHLRRPNADAWMEGGRQSHNNNNKIQREQLVTLPPHPDSWRNGQKENLHNNCARAHGSRMHGSRAHGSRMHGSRAHGSRMRGTRAHGTTHVQNSTLRNNKTTPSHKMGRRQIRRQHGHQNLWKPTHWWWKPTHWWRQIHRQHGHQNGNVYF